MSRSRSSGLTHAVQISIGAVGALFAIQLAVQLLHLPWLRYGIVPRTWAGLAGILFAPLLHANWGHVMANALPLLVLLILLLADRQYYPFRTLAFIWLVGGLGAWLIGRPRSIHVGASSLIFGLIVYLIMAGFLMGKWRPALIALVVALLFGSALYGVVPQSGPVSWEGHLGGAVAGLLAARWNYVRGASGS